MADSSLKYKVGDKDTLTHKTGIDKSKMLELMYEFMMQYGQVSSFIEFLTEEEGYDVNQQEVARMCGYS